MFVTTELGAVRLSFHLMKRMEFNESVYLTDWQKNLFELSDTRILFYLRQKVVVRYSDLLEGVIKSRSTLAGALTQLQRQGLIERKVKDTRPIQTEYALTEKGKDFAQLLIEIKELLKI